MAQARSTPSARAKRYARLSRRNARLAGQTASRISARRISVADRLGLLTSRSGIAMKACAGRRRHLRSFPSFDAPDRFNDQNSRPAKSRNCFCINPRTSGIGIRASSASGRPRPISRAIAKPTR
ncbi:hypothetical protein [Lysobacter gummosus]|uniref:hypothetical protein n=1 Tax=Lysobacter gummosus TaxID=262324 RepID=UPI003626DF86